MVYGHVSVRREIRKSRSAVLRQRRARPFAFRDEGKAFPESRARARDKERACERPSERAPSSCWTLLRERKMAKRKGSSSSCPRTSCPRTSCPRSQAANEGRDATDVESTQRFLEKLPPEVWRKILAELDWNDLFPLALSCKFFRQKQLQKAQAARTRRDGPESDDTRSYLETNLRQKLDEGQPASVEYLRFLRKEEELRGVSPDTGDGIMCLAALHGYLPLLQEDLKSLGDGPLNMITREVAECAGESSLTRSFPLLCFGF